jgi:hypothetical protein
MPGRRRTHHISEASALPASQHVRRFRCSTRTSKKASGRFTMRSRPLFGAEHPAAKTARAFFVCDLLDPCARVAVLQIHPPSPTSQTPSVGGARPNAGHRNLLPNARKRAPDAENPLRGAWTFSLGTFRLSWRARRAGQYANAAKAATAKMPNPSIAIPSGS